MNNGSARWARIAGALALAASASSCGPAYYKRDADEETYKVVAQKQAAALGSSSPHFTIEPPENTLREELLAEERAGATVPRTLTDLDALRIAAENNRDFREQRERVYLAALDLTLERHMFEIRYLDSGSAEVAREASGDKTGSADNSFSITRALETGGTIALTLTTSLFRLFSSPTENTSTSIISLAITQPLLRGAGKVVALEGLTQAERDAVYAVREYERFKQELAVDVASTYFRVLQGLDEVDNEKLNYDNSLIALERTQSLADAGRLPQFQVDQAKQNQLRARDRVIAAEESYNGSLDRLKLLLGLPTDAPVVLDPAELTQLAERGVNPVDIDSATGVSVALDRRLDLKNSHDRVEDSRRKVVVAENALEMGLDLVAGAAYASGTNRPADFDFGNGRYAIGLDFDLPLDRKAQRNALRAAIIETEARKRAAEQAEDNVKLNVRDEVRRLREARESYEIQKVSVALAKTQIESTTLFLQAGRADTRDLLDAQQQLVTARNSLTRSLVDHELSRLELFRDMGTLVVDETGLTYETSSD